MIEQRLNSINSWAKLLAILALALAFLGGLFNQTQFFRSYLIAYVFWLGLGLGSLAIALLSKLVGGRWGQRLNVPLRAAVQTIPILVLLYVPLFWGIEELYKWTQPGVMNASELLQRKSSYLNTSFFTTRSIFYLLVWFLLALMFSAGRSQVQAAGRHTYGWSAPGLIVLALTISFASFDWLMSLEPEWYSSMYGVIIIVGQLLAAMALAIACLMCLSIWRLEKDPPAPKQVMRDLGNLLLAFVLIWTYVSFSQFLIIWSGNLPEEVIWYTRRLSNGWQWLAIALLLFHFALPFLFLLHRRIKEAPRTLLAVALLILAFRFLDLYWVISPAFETGSFTAHWLDPVSFLALGAIWLSSYLNSLKRIHIKEKEA